MKKKIIDFTIRELAKICKKHKSNVDFNVCYGCKLRRFGTCIASYPVEILSVAKQKQIEVQE